MTEHRTTEWGARVVYALLALAWLGALLWGAIGLGDRPTLPTPVREATR